MKSYRIAQFILILLLMSLACKLPTPGKTPEPNVFYPNLLYVGELTFMTDQATASEAGYKPVHGCWPPSYYDDGLGYLNFVEEGLLQGVCAWESPSEVNPLVTWNTEGFLRGTYELSTGALIFHLETQADYPLMSTINLTFDATGFFTSPTHAEGIASYTSTCRSIGPEDHCGTTPGASENTHKSWNITGTVPWTMDFGP